MDYEPSIQLIRFRIVAGHAWPETTGAVFWVVGSRASSVPRSPQLCRRFVLFATAVSSCSDRSSHRLAEGRKKERGGEKKETRGKKMEINRAKIPVDTRVFVVAKISFSITQCLLRIARSSRVPVPLSVYPRVHTRSPAQETASSLFLVYLPRIWCALRRCIRIRVLGYDRVGPLSGPADCL